MQQEKSWLLNSTLSITFWLQSGWSEHTLPRDSHTEQNINSGQNAHDSYDSEK